MTFDISSVCLQALYEARKTLEDIKIEGRERVGTEKDREKEPVTKGDLVISKVLRKCLLDSGLPAVIYSEESKEPMYAVENPLYRVYFDELDGTFNYSRGIFPVTTVISAFDYTPQPKFKDAIFAAVMDHTSDKLWHAKKGKGCFLNDKKVKTSGKTELGKNTSVIIDHGPCSRDIERFLNIYASTWVRNVSSAGFHLAGVASGNFDAYICPIQKAHELGAGYLLVKEAGGYITDFEGNFLDKQEFNFNGLYPIVASATPELTERLREKIKR